MIARRVRIVLQARTTSTRLPAKVLLPVGGIPLAILCARRLGSSGREVVLATSDTPSDDVLASIAEANAIRVHRGSLDDVLTRFLDCTADLADEDLIVRATADNAVPDGAFVDQLISVFETMDTDYLGAGSSHDGLPYGLAAEVFTAGALRRSAVKTNDPFDREHVTVQLGRDSGGRQATARDLLLSGDRSHLRVSIDTLEDYLAIAELFGRALNPEAISWRRLIDDMTSTAARPARIPSRWVGGAEYGAVTLGTVQLGLSYGIANLAGCPGDDEASAILSTAIAAGVTHLDTARAYGNAEARIGRLMAKDAGQRLRIVSKIAPMTDVPDTASTREVESAVDASVFGSCRDLGRSRIDVMLFHRSADMCRWGGAACDRLAAHAENGVIGEWGASVYTPDEAVHSMVNPRATHIQIPINVLDDRWFGSGFQQALAARPDMKVHARSVFLQGLLLSDVDVWPGWVANAGSLVSSLQSLTKRFDRKGLTDFCMAYVRSLPWVTSLVIGVEAAAQLREVLSLIHEPPLAPEAAVAVREVFRGVPERLLNPGLW
jgi:spore coat polysaccharide biosynthesis protein SpsF (cytidylyltransferase family)/aryl-alcohol dehydrogenase-like predicted oxidoreductase